MFEVNFFPTLITACWPIESASSKNSAIPGQKIWNPTIALTTIRDYVSAAHKEIPEHFSAFPLPLPVWSLKSRNLPSTLLRRNVKTIFRQKTVMPAWFPDTPQFLWIRFFPEHCPVLSTNFLREAAKKQIEPCRVRPNTKRFLQYLINENLLHICRRDKLKMKKKLTQESKVGTAQILFKKI